MGLLYIVENGTTLGIRGGSFTVKYQNKAEDMIPKETITGICIFGKTQITTQCIEFCLKKGIKIGYFSGAGTFYRTLASPNGTNIKRLRKQLQLTSDEDFSLTFAKRIIDAKIHNQFVVANRYQKNREIKAEKQFFQMKNAKKHVLQAGDIAELMGYEGIASRNYFEILAMLIESDFCFSHRNRRPSTDPFNAMLNLGYSLLSKEIFGQLENRNLTPYAGFLHKDKEKHPALASDMLEEWRPVIVDSCVLSLIQGHEIGLEHFYFEKEGCSLTKDGIRIFLSKLEQKMYTPSKYLSNISSPISFRQAIWHQAETLASAIDQENYEIYKPIYIR